MLKTIAVVGGIVTILTGFVKIAEFFEDRSQLTAEVSVAAFSLPPNITEESDRIRAAISNTDAVRQAVGLSATDPQQGLDADQIRLLPPDIVAA